MSIGRPTLYNEALALEICTRLADGESLRKICNDEHMPHRHTVLNWAMDTKHPFFDQYARARDIQADTYADEIVDIADDGTLDWVEMHTRQGAKIVGDHEHIQRSRLRVDSRKWIASKLKPKRYGDKITTEHTGADGKDLFNHYNSAEQKELAERLLLNRDQGPSQK
jgi:hypothetical protein